MALGDIAPERENLLAGSPVSAPDDLELARREVEERLDLERQINFAIDEINANPNIPSEIKSELVNNLRSLKTGLGANPNLAQVQKEINDARAIAHQASTTSAIYNSLSVAGQARVDASMAALSEGRYADYYLDSIDPNHQMLPGARAAISDSLAKDPDFVKSSNAYVLHSEPVKKDTETRMQKRMEDLEARIAAAKTDEERASLEKALKYQLHRIPGFNKDLKDASPEQVAALVDKHMQVLRMQVESIPLNTDHGRALKKYFSSDGYGIDADAVLELGRTEQAQKALIKLHTAGMDFSKLSEEDQRLAAAGLAANIEQAKFTARTAHLTAFEGLYQKLSPEKQVELKAAFDKNVNEQERLSLVIKAYREEGGSEYAAMSDERLKKIATAAIRAFDAFPDAEKAVRGQTSVSLAEKSRWLDVEEKLSNQRNFKPEQIDALKTMVINDPSAMKQLELAARVQANQRSYYTAEQVNQASKSIARAVDVATNPEYKDTMSRLRYFNLQDTQDGRALFNAVILDNLSASEAASRIEPMRQQLFARMENFVEQVPKMLDAEYNAILKNAHMFKADGTLDVEKLLETARINRDKLDASDAGLKTVTDKKWEELNLEEKERRVIARAAVRFKAIDAVEQFGENLAQVTDQIRGNAALSEAFLKDKKLFEQINDSSNPEAQKQALDEVLKSLQYLRVNDELRKEVTNDMAALISSGTLVFGEQRAAASQTISAPLVETPPTPPVSAVSPITAAPPTPDLAHEQVFDTTIKIDSREQQGSTGLDNLSKSSLEKAILGAVQNLLPETRQQILGSLLGSFNEVDPNFISYNEIENAVRAVDKTKNSNEILAAIDSNGSGALSLSEITTYLANAGVSGGQGVTSNSTPPAQSVPSVATGTPAPTPGR